MLSEELTVRLQAYKELSRNRWELQDFRMVCSKLLVLGGFGFVFLGFLFCFLLLLLFAFSSTYVASIINKR